MEAFSTNDTFMESLQIRPLQGRPLQSDSSHNTGSYECKPTWHKRCAAGMVAPPEMWISDTVSLTAFTDVAE